MIYYLLPLAGVAIGAIGALTGTGGGVLTVPLLLTLLLLPKEIAVGTSFVNMIFIVVVSLLLYGAKGTIDWKAGILLGLGSVIGAYLAVTYFQPHISERQFHYAFAALLVIIAVSLVFKK